MQRSRVPLSDEKLAQFIGALLRAGVLLAAGVVLLGAVFYLAQRGFSPPRYHVFRGEPADLRSISGVMKDLFSFRPAALIQFGVLLLIATPIARVLFSLFAFFREGDGTYVFVTLLVFSLLIFSLVGGGI